MSLMGDMKLTLENLRTGEVVMFPDGGLPVDWGEVRCQRESGQTTVTLITPSGERYIGGWEPNL